MSLSYYDVGWLGCRCWVDVVIVRGGFFDGSWIMLLVEIDVWCWGDDFGNYGWWYVVWFGYCNYWEDEEVGGWVSLMGGIYMLVIIYNEKSKEWFGCFGICGCSFLF